MLRETKASRNEVFFLPPLNMELSFLDREADDRGLQNNDNAVKMTVDKMTVTKLIEKLSEKEHKD